MSRVLTYLDANVLITAQAGKADLAERAFSIIGDSSRTFAASIFLKLELLPNSRGKQLEFYEEYFGQVGVMADDLRKITQSALVEGRAHGVAALDALHLAAAASVGAELITFERPTKPLFRSSLVKVTSLHPDATNVL
jgi:predicted nucleic acid-binding protein